MGMRICTLAARDIEQGYNAAADNVVRMIHVEVSQ